ncbi:MAG TPA: Rieske (2Fe-2S) protein [Flavipsychrobacter sp.]|nr:Rieske (2Fe-2S) protein [Flavipsychrobacter sp.]
MLYNWVKLENVALHELEEQKIKDAKLGEKMICILKKQEKIHAFAATCPHQGAPLCEGWIDAQGRIVCALHKYRFDPANGRNTSGEGYKLRTYPVEIRDGFIYVGIIE